MPVIGEHSNQGVAVSAWQKQGAGVTGGIFDSVILLSLSSAIFCLFIVVPSPLGVFSPLFKQLLKR